MSTLQIYIILAFLTFMWICLAYCDELLILAKEFELKNPSLCFDHQNVEALVKLSKLFSQNGQQSRTCNFSDFSKWDINALSSYSIIGKEYLLKFNKLVFKFKTKIITITCTSICYESH